MLGSGLRQHFHLTSTCVATAGAAYSKSYMTCHGPLFACLALVQLSSLVRAMSYLVHDAQTTEIPQEAMPADGIGFRTTAHDRGLNNQSGVWSVLLNSRCLK